MRWGVFLLVFSLSVPAWSALFPWVPEAEVQVVEAEADRLLLRVSSDEMQAASFTELSLEKVFSYFGPETPLQQALREIYLSRGCTAEGYYPEMGELPCGWISEPNERNSVVWSYGRSGWGSAYSIYKVFIQFTESGSGGFTDVALEVTLGVDVNSPDWDASSPVQFDVEMMIIDLQPVE